MEYRHIRGFERVVTVVVGGQSITFPSVKQYPK